jgi:hypothetical protein
MLLVSHLVKKSPLFMGPEGLLPHSQEHTIGTCPETRRKPFKILPSMAGSTTWSLPLMVSECTRMFCLFFTSLMLHAQSTSFR